MNDRPTLWVAGAHRGARSLTRHLLSDANTAAFGECVVIDRREDRAESFLRSLPIGGRALVADAAEALASADAGDVVAITVDTVAATRSAITAAARRQRLAFQLVGRNAGLGGVHFALGGTLRPGDDDVRRDVELLFATLDELSSTPSSSNRAIADTGDPLPPMLLAPLRDRISAAITADLLRGEGDRSASGMTIVFPNGTFRLLIAPNAPRASITGQKEQAVALARERCATSPIAVAFLHVSESRIRMLLLRADSSGRWSVHGAHDFAPPPDGMPKVTVTD